MYFLESTISLKNSGSFQWRMDLETTIWELRALIVTELVTDSRLLEWIELGKQLFKFQKYIMALYWHYQSKIKE